jgi:hypothetical protein
MVASEAEQTSHALRYVAGLSAMIVVTHEPLAGFRCISADATDFTKEDDPSLIRKDLKHMAMSELLGVWTPFSTCLAQM